MAEKPIERYGQNLKRIIHINYRRQTLGTIERRSGWQGAPSQLTAFSKLSHWECLDTLNRAKRFPNSFKGILRQTTFDFSQTNPEVLQQVFSSRYQTCRIRIWSCSPIFVNTHVPSYELFSSVGKCVFTEIALRLF
jgi:hypothetical protein